MNRTLLLLSAFILTLQLSSCSIDDSLNNTPNDVLESQLATKDGVLGLLVSVQTMTGDFYSADRSRIATMWTWQMCAPHGLGRAQAESWDNYGLSEDGPPNDMWLYAYKAYRNCNDLLRFVKPTYKYTGDPVADPNIAALIKGIAHFHKGLIIGEVAALWGSCPVEIPNLDPAKFMTQAEAYAAAQRFLDTALTEFVDGSIGQDLNFGGVAAQWKGAAHSLKARYYLHVSDYAKALAEAKLGISSAGGTYFAFYSETIREYSPWGHWSIEEGNTIRLEKNLVDSLKSEAGDRRLAEFVTPNSKGNYQGYAAHGEAVGMDSDALEADLTSVMNKYNKHGDHFPMISYQENVLIKAECEAETGDLAGAVTDVNIIRTAAGLPAYASTDKNAIIAQILKQKYMQLFLEGQAYHDMRRRKTLPDPQPGSNIRIIYPINEKSTNPYTPANSDALVKPLSAY